MCKVHTRRTYSCMRTRLRTCTYTTYTLRVRTALNSLRRCKFVVPCLKPPCSTHTVKRIKCHIITKRPFFAAFGKRGVFHRLEMQSRRLLRTMDGRSPSPPRAHGARRGCRRICVHVRACKAKQSVRRVQQRVPHVSAEEEARPKPAHNTSPNTLLPSACGG